MRRVIVLMGVLAVCGLWSSTGLAQEAGESSSDDGGEEGTASEESTDEADGGSSQESAASVRQARQLPEAILRFGRVESVLLENDDPESAIEFGMEMIRDGFDSARLRFLLGTCYMRLERYSEAIEQWERAIRDAGEERDIELRVLYNLGRAHHRAGRLAEAADAFDRYVAFARAHDDLHSFIEEAQRMSRLLRARANQ